jgi:hypothetical protein
MVSLRSQSIGPMVKTLAKHPNGAPVPAPSTGPSMPSKCEKWSSHQIVFRRVGEDFSFLDTGALPLPNENPVVALQRIRRTCSREHRSTGHGKRGDQWPDQGIRLITKRPQRRKVIAVIFILPARKVRILFCFLCLALCAKGLMESGQTGM